MNNMDPEKSSTILDTQKTYDSQEYARRSRDEILALAYSFRVMLHKLKEDDNGEMFLSSLGKFIAKALPYLPAQNRLYWQEMKERAVNGRPQVDRGAVRLIGLKRSYYLEMIDKLIIDVSAKEKMELIWEIDSFLLSSNFFTSDGLNLIKRSKQFLSAEDADYYLEVLENCNGCYLQIMQNTDVDFDSEGALNSLKNEVRHYLERLVEILNR